MEPPTVPADLNKVTLEEAVLQNTLIATATSSWEAISAMSGQIQDADGSVEALTTRVNSALTTLGRAADTREAAEEIIEGEFAVSVAELCTIFV